MRINKYLADAGVASRREADRLIEAGRVTVNGRKPGLGDQVEEGDEVLFDGRPVRPVQKKTVIAFHKPVGVITTTDAAAPDNIMGALHAASAPPPPGRLIPVGRLDVASSGLILFTDDSALADRLMRPDSGTEKEYDVIVDKELTDEFLTKMSKGVRLENMPAPQRIVMTRPARVKEIGATRFLIVITEGKNRQIRRMCEALGYEVRHLRRTRVGGVELADLPEGEWRPLSRQELASL
jgi:23S rRNA pseudouridine2604 synthase